MRYWTRTTANAPLVALLLASLTLGPVALAQPTSQPTAAPASQPVLRELPKGERLKTPQGERQGYSLEEMKVLLHIYADYRSWGLQVPQLKLQVDRYGKITLNQSNQLKLQEEQIKILHGERRLLTDKWSKENEKRHLCENKPAFGSWIAWGTAGVMAVVAAVLAGILIVKGKD